MVTVSTVRCAYTRTSGQRVSTLGRTSSNLARKRSAMASLIFSAAKFRLCNGLCCAVISTLKVCAGVNQISHATLAAALYRSCSPRYWLCCSSISTRCASRLCRLSCNASRHEPCSCTPARQALPSIPVMRLISVANSASTPAAQGRNSWSWFIFNSGSFYRKGAENAELRRGRKTNFKNESLRSC